MSVASDLALLGWRTDTPARLSQAVRDFQLGWNLGPALAVDGNPGPATRAAIALSVQRRRDGLPDYSEHFNAREFRCQCDLQRGGPWPDCRRIWITRATVRVAEQWRGLIGPYSPDRGCRCPTENRRVNGATNSQHLHGRALDVPVYLTTVDQARALRSISGIGYYRVTLLGGSTVRVVRHIDTRASATAAAPALWEYGTYRGTPATPRPPGPTPTVPTKPPPPPLPPRSWFDMATKEDLRAVVQEEINRALADENVWRKAFTGMRFFKDPTTPNRGESPDEPRIPLGRLLELAAGAAIDATDTQAVRDAFAEAVSANLAVTVTAEPVKEA